MKKITSSFFALTIAALFSVSASADIIYDVSSTGLLNCGPSGHHGLWTNNDVSGGSCPNYFDFQSGSTLVIDNSNANSALWTATMTATARNPSNVLATLDLVFSGFSDDHTAFTVKNGGGASAAEIADWLFFSDVSGTISVAGYSTYTINDLAGTTGLQIGMGANDKTHTFGASAWLKGNFGSDHWDINMDLALADVPEPGLLSLMAIGLLAMGLATRRRSFATTI